MPGHKKSNTHYQMFILPSYMNLSTYKNISYRTGMFVISDLWSWPHGSSVIITISEFTLMSYD